MKSPDIVHVFDVDDWWIPGPAEVDDMVRQTFRVDLTETPAPAAIRTAGQDNAPVPLQYAVAPLDPREGIGRGLFHRDFVRFIGQMFGLPHTLAIMPGPSGLVVNVLRAGECIAPHVDSNPLSIVVFLREPAGGGALVFRDLGIRIAPRAGRAVAFPGHTDHEVEKVEGGERVTVVASYAGPDYVRPEGLDAYTFGGRYQ